MRPSKIREAASTLKDIIDKSEVIDALEITSNKDLTTPKDKILEASNYISRKLGETKDNEYILAKKTRFIDISSPDFWKPLLTKDKIDPDVACGKLALVSKMRDLLDTLSTLLESPEANLRYSSNRNHFTLVLPKTDGKGRHVSQMREALDALETLYNVHQFLYNLEREEEDETPLRVTTAETGSELAFVFLGAAPALTAVGALLLLVWDRIQFSPERKLSEQMKSISESLDVLEEIDQKKDRIGERRAEKMKRDVTNSVRSTLEAGAIPEESQDIHQEAAKRVASNETRALPEEAKPQDNESD